MQPRRPMTTPIDREEVLRVVERRAAGHRAKFEGARADFWDTLEDECLAILHDLRALPPLDRGEGEKLRKLAPRLFREGEKDD